MIAQYKLPPLLARLLGGTALVVALGTGQAQAQLIIDPPREVAPPWNALKPFESTPLPNLSEPETRDPVAPEDTPVRTRLRPEYAPRGIRFGPWMYYPTATAGAFYDSNVFSSSTDKQADFASRFATGLRAQSLWERHSLDVRLIVDTTSYRRNTSLNETNVDFSANGRIDIDHGTQLLSRFQAAYLHDEVGSLSSPAGAVEPTPYGFFSGDVTLRKQFGRFTASGGARVDRYDYRSVRAGNGATINQDARDGEIYTVHGRIDYALSEKSAVFAAFENNWRELRGTPTASLDSSGYRALAGINLELTRLIRGEFAAGYLRQRFASPAIGDVSGPAYRAALTWSPTRQLDVHFKTEQVVTTTSDTSPTAALATSFQLGADYEIRPNLIFSPLLVYEKDKFKGIPRDDSVYAAELRLKRLINNWASTSAYYRYLQRDSNIQINSYDKHVIGINASLQF
jgi:hypothetical protein